MYSCGTTCESRADSQPAGRLPTRSCRVAKKHCSEHAKIALRLALTIYTTQRSHHHQPTLVEKKARKKRLSYTRSVPQLPSSLATGITLYVESTLHETQTNEIRRMPYTYIYVKTVSRPCRGGITPPPVLQNKQSPCLHV